MIDFPIYDRVPMPKVPIFQPNRITGEGRRHARGWYRERKPVGAYAKQHKRMKMKKASRRRNRGADDG